MDKEFEQKLLKNIKNGVGDYESSEKDAQLIVNIIKVISDNKEPISISYAEKILHDVKVALKETIAI